MKKYLALLLVDHIHCAFLYAYFRQYIIVLKLQQNVYQSVS